MASDLVTSSVEQHCIIKFQWKWTQQKFFVSQMHGMGRRLVTWRLYDSYLRFSESYREVLNVWMLTFSCAWCEHFLCWADFEKRANYSAWCCIQLWHKCWKFWNNYPWTHVVQENVCLVVVLTFSQKVWHVVVSAEHLHWFISEGNTFLEWIMTCDETWVHCFILESEWSSMEWHHKGCPIAPKKFNKQQSAGKCVLGFWRNNSCWFSSIWCNS
jgi:hypothetical protein